MSLPFVRPLISLAAIAAAAPAAADQLTPDPDADIVEVSHEVTVTFPAADLVEMTVRRSFANRGARVAGFELEVVLPEAAVVTGMRSRSGGVWHRAALLAADVARRRFESQPAAAGVPDQDPVLLSHAGPGRVAITAAEVPAGGALSIEYSLRAPATREDGRLRATYHHDGGEGLVAPVLRVSGRARVDGVPVIGGAPRVLSAAAPSAGPSAVTTLLTLPDDLVARSAKVRAFITHPRPIDLLVDLVNAEGQRQRLIAGHDHRALERLRAGVALAPALVGELGETWKLVVTDRATGSDGVLHSWRLDVIDTGGKPSVHRVRQPVKIPDAVADDDDPIAAAVIEAVRDPGRITARHGRVLFAAGKSSVTRLHIDAPDAFAPAPDDLHVVFVLDTSRSLSDDEVAAQLDVAAAYLAAAPGARFELVRFDRRARRLLNRFAPAAEMAALRARLVAAGELASANGSHLERGLKVAARALRDARGKTSRIVILTDGLMRSKFPAAAARRAIRSGTIAHLVKTMGLAGAADRRLDQHSLAPIAAGTGGMAIAIDPDTDPGELARSALHLVRPIRVDHFAVSAPFTEEAREGGALYEGTGRRFAAVLDQASPAAITIRGKLWARAIDRVVPATAAGSDLAAALVFGTGDHVGIPDAEIERIAMRGHVVSPATSFLTVRPGERERLGSGGWGIGSTCSACAFGTIGSGFGTGAAPAPITLRGPLASCAEKLGPAVDLEARVDLETSLIEIVDVEVTAADPRARACLTEAIWAHRLRPEQSRGELAKVVVQLSRAQL